MLTTNEAIRRLRQGDEDAAHAWLDQSGDEPSDDSDAREATQLAARVLWIRGDQ